MKFQPKSILITGGAGFIGANFIKSLVGKTSAKIINLDKLTYAADLDYLGENPCDNYKLIKGSITDERLVDNLFAEYKIDCVIHFAAESHVDRSISNPIDFIQTNIVGTANLLEIARKHWQGKSFSEVRFHHISTDEVFGSLDISDDAFNEFSAYDPSSPYSASKASSDHLVRAWSRTYDLPVTISNCSNNYGPGQNAEKLIPTVIRKALLGESIPVYGDGSNRRDWLFVLDHCEAIWQIIENGKEKETYMIGGGVELPNNEVVAIICEQLDKIAPKEKSYKNQIEFVKDRAGHDWRYAVDAKKIKDALGWQAKYSFEQAIRETIDSYILKEEKK